MRALAGKAAIVTGAGGAGCGRAVALRFAGEGALVVAADIDDEGGRETVRLIEEAGGKAVYRRTDVRDDVQVREVFALAERTFGIPAVLVNDASASYHGDEPLEHWDDPLRTDLMGMMACTRCSIEAMRRGGGGAIVNFSSSSSLGHGRKFVRGSPAYDAMKAAVLRFTTALAPFVKDHRIHLNCLVPDWIGVPQVREVWETWTPAERQAYGAPSRLIPVEGIADAVHRLATDDSLNGRVMVWWSEEPAPRLIPWADPGYAELV